MNESQSKERPDELLFKLSNRFLSTLLEVLSSIAIGTIVVGKFVFDSLHRSFVEPRLAKKRKMRDEHRATEDLPYDDAK